MEEDNNPNNNHGTMKKAAGRGQEEVAKSGKQAGQYVDISMLCLFARNP